MFSTGKAADRLGAGVKTLQHWPSQAGAHINWPEDLLQGGRDAFTQHSPSSSATLYWTADCTKSGASFNTRPRCVAGAS
jgi:hypothetical protein